MAVTTKVQADQGSSNGERPAELESFKPATGERIGTVPTVTPDQVQGRLREEPGIHGNRQCT